MYETGEFYMIYALLSWIPFVTIYMLLGGPALGINFWLGDRNQFVQPGVVVYLALCDKLMGTCGLRNRDQHFQSDRDQKGTLGSQNRDQNWRFMKFSREQNFKDK